MLRQNAQYYSVWGALLVWGYSWWFAESEHKAPLANEFQSVNIVQPSLCLSANGSIDIIADTALSGAVTYSINDGANYFPNSKFTGLGPGNYYLKLRVVNGPSVSIFEYPFNPVTLTAPDAPVIVSVEYPNSPVADYPCGIPDATVTINATGGAGPLEYNFVGTNNWQSSNTLNTFSLGTVFNVMVRSGSCVVGDNRRVLSDDVGYSSIFFTDISYEPPSDCNNNDGIIRFTLNGGDGRFCPDIHGAVNPFPFPSPYQWTYTAGGPSWARTLSVEAGGIPNGVYEPGGFYAGCEACPTGSGVIIEFDAPAIVDRQITICEGNSYELGGQSFTLSGQYTVNVPGGDCDSIINLDLSVLPTITNFISAEICEGGAYLFGEQALTTSGVFEETFTTPSGCDSIVTLDLTVLPVPVTPMYVEICQFESFEFEGQMYDQEGIYEIVLTNPETGCDSVVELNISIHYIPVIDIYASICEGEFYYVGEEAFGETRDYYTVRMIEPVTGCDSIVLLHLYVKEVPEINLRPTICEGETYSVGDNVYSESGIYTDTLTGPTGCDSIVNLFLTVHPIPEVSISRKICEGDFFIDDGNVFDQPGQYTYTLTGPTGCDSIVNLALTVHPIPIVEVSATICEGDIYIIGESNGFTESGNYTVTLTGPTGCDSIVNLALTVHPIPQVEVSATICEGDIYIIGESNGFTESGNYTVTLTGPTGCDSIVHLDLTVHPIPQVEVSATICEGDIYIIGESNGFTENGNYTVTLTGPTGCDSIVNLALTVHPILQVEISATICEGNIYIVGESNGFTESGNYTVTLTGPTGCDSIVNLALTVSQSEPVIRQAAICQGQTYTWNGKIYAEPGSYTDTLFATGGCKQLFTLMLEVLPRQHDTTRLEICAGDSLLWREGYYFEAGIYRDSSVSGDCISMHLLFLEVHSSPITNWLVYQCEGAPFHWEGSSYAVSGRYEKHFTGVTGCDSTVVLDLQFQKSSPVNVIRSTICEGDSLQFGNRYVKTAGRYELQLLNRFGCDSTVQLQLSVTRKKLQFFSGYFCEGDTVRFGNQVITTPGAYSDTLQSTGGCDSILLLSLQSQERVLFQTEKVICPGEVFTIGSRRYEQTGHYLDTLRSGTGCDTVIDLSLSVLSEKVVRIDTLIWPGDTVLFGSKTYSSQGLFSDTLSAKSGCDSILLISIGVHTAPEIDSVSIHHPNVCSPIDGSIAFFTRDTGWLFSIDDGQNWLENPVFDSLGSGVYILRLATSDTLPAPGFSDTIVFPFQEPMQLRVAGFEPPLCPNEAGFASLIASGGRPPYRFLWPDGHSLPEADHLPPGQYLVQVEDQNGCQSSLEVEIPEAQTERMDLIPQDSIWSCQGMTQFLDLSHLTGTFQWNGPNGWTADTNFVQLIDSGQYFLTFQPDSGCVQLDTLQLAPLDGFFAARFLAPSEVVVGQEVVLVEISWPPPQKIDWLLPQDGIEIITQDLNKVHLRFSETGTFKIGMTAGLGACENTLEKTILVVADSSLIGQNQLAVPTNVLDFRLFPNPNNGQFQVAVSLKDARDIQLRIYSDAGVLLGSRLGKGSADYLEAFQFPNLRPGVYSLILISGTEQRTLLFIVL